MMSGEMSIRGDTVAKIKAVSDEEIIAALIQHETVKSAALSLGISPRTIYDREESREFRSAYYRARDEVLRAAVFNLNAKLAEAIDTVSLIMNDEGINAATRLQAAQIVINSAVKLADHLKEAEKTSRAEAKTIWESFEL